MVQREFWTSWSELPQNTSNLRVLHRVLGGNCVIQDKNLGRPSGNPSGGPSGKTKIFPVDPAVDLVVEVDLSKIFGVCQYSNHWFSQDW